jgi:hypothetical protein
MTIIPNNTEYSSKEIIAIINDMMMHTGTTAEKKLSLSKKYPEFEQRFPVLFESACDPTFDYARFTNMLRLRDQVLNNETTLESASKKVGQDLFNKYVEPIITHSP